MGSEMCIRDRSCWRRGGSPANMVPVLPGSIFSSPGACNPGQSYYFLLVYFFVRGCQPHSKNFFFPLNFAFFEIANPQTKPFYFFQLFGFVWGWQPQESQSNFFIFCIVQGCQLRTKKTLFFYFLSPFSLSSNAHTRHDTTRPTAMTASSHAAAGLLLPLLGCGDDKGDDEGCSSPSPSSSSPFSLS